MPAVDLAPLMDSPRWKTLGEPIRAELKNCGRQRHQRRGPRPHAPEDAGTTDSRPVESPAPHPGGSTSLAPRRPRLASPQGRVCGTQRLPFQAGAPAEATRPGIAHGKRRLTYVPRPVQGVIEGMAGPSNVLEGVATLAVPGPLKPVAAGAAAGQRRRYPAVGRRASRWTGARWPTKPLVCRARGWRICVSVMG